MKRFLTFVYALIGFGVTPAVAQTQPLDYEQLILLDAEALAETGIKEAYGRVLPSLKRYVREPAIIDELIDGDTPSYVVLALGARYEIYSPRTSQEQSWANATSALFDIVNRQLMNQPFKLYAINGGNDLGGVFLTEVQYRAAMASLKKKTDWPYIPNQEAPWYGQAH